MHYERDARNKRNGSSFKEQPSHNEQSKAATPCLRLHSSFD
ncbi:MAG: hypothetical protein WC967_04745 [Balneolaceae bacterium]